MTIWRLVGKELLHRKASFALAAASAAVAVACLAGAAVLLAAHDAQTRAILTERERQTRQRLAGLEDDVRKAALKLGFNVLILPKDQDVREVALSQVVSKTMPEEYADRLAKAPIVTITHLLPVVQEKLRWPERNTDLILIGTRGELPQAQQDPKKPLLQPVGPGQMIVGAQLARDLGLKVGEDVTLLGSPFKVVKVYPPRDNEDDVGAWIDLATAQKLLGRAGRINAILALSCDCVGTDPAKIRQELATILPDTQVREFGSKLIARAEMRARAAQEASQSLEAERASREQLRRTRETIAAVLVGLVLLAAAAWMGLLAWSNVRQRRGEIGILRTVGVGVGRIAALFLARAAVVGLVGAAVGLVVGAAVGMAWGGLSLAEARAALSPLLALAVLAAAAALSAVACLPPAMLAATQDPAEVLRAE